MRIYIYIPVCMTCACSCMYHALQLNLCKHKQLRSYMYVETCAYIHTNICMYIHLRTTYIGTYI